MELGIKLVSWARRFNSLISWSDQVDSCSSMSSPHETCDHLQLLYAVWTFGCGSLWDEHIILVGTYNIFLFNYLLATAQQLLYPGLIFKPCKTNFIDFVWTQNHRRMGWGGRGGGAAALPNFGQPRFFWQQEKFVQRRLHVSWHVVFVLFFFCFFFEDRYFLF